MAKVVHGKRLAEDEEPDEHIAAEGKRILKNLVVQQLDTAITLDSQQKRERTFVPGTPLADLAVPSGAVPSGSFSALQEKEEIRLKLLGAGVDPEDVRKLFANETGKLSEPERLARLQLWNEAAQRLLDADDQVNASPSSFRRLEEELRACVPATGFYAHFLHTQKKPLPSASTQPDNDILTKELRKTEKELSTHLHTARPPSATGRKRRRDRKVADSLALYGSETNDAPQQSRCTGSLWDVKSVSHEHRSSVCLPASVSKATPEPKASQKSKVVGCSQQRFYTIKDGVIVELKGKQATENRSNLISSSIDTKNKRMTIDEIREHPKFSNYLQGTPNKVLFVKNFPPRLAEAELLAIFSEYDPVECRLMTGRMKGQAFVTFTDNETAQRALDGVIGTIIESKPLVVQFGRSDSSATEKK